jgi:broad specificity phosphatase PhoE
MLREDAAAIVNPAPIDPDFRQAPFSHSATAPALRVLGCLCACADCGGFGRVLINSCEAVSNFARRHLRGVMGCGASSTGSHSSSGGSRLSDHLAVAARNRGDNPLTAVFHASAAHASSPLRRIIFVRHASAAPPPTAADTAHELTSDLERALTGRGRQQCALARDSWMSGVQPCLAITSQAVRTAETLALTLPQLEPARVRVLAQLHPSRCGPDCAAMLGALGPGGPLRRYRADTSLGIDGVSAFHNYGVDVCGGSGQQANLHSLLTTAARLGRDGGGDTVVIFGHAVLLVAVAVAVARAMGCSAAVVEQLLDCELGECEGIALTCQQPPHGHSFVEHLSSAGG